MPQPLTPTQTNVLSFIRSYRVTNGYSPTLQEIADELVINKVSVLDHVNALERKGHITRAKFKSRSIEIVEDKPRDVIRKAVSLLTVIAEAPTREDVLEVVGILKRA